MSDGTIVNKQSGSEESGITQSAELTSIGDTAPPVGTEVPHSTNETSQTDSTIESANKDLETKLEDALEELKETDSESKETEAKEEESKSITEFNSLSDAFQYLGKQVKIGNELAVLYSVNADGFIEAPKGFYRKLHEVVPA